MTTFMTQEMVDVLTTIAWIIAPLLMLKYLLKNIERKKYYKRKMYSVSDGKVYKEFAEWLILDQKDIPIGYYIIEDDYTHSVVQDETNLFKSLYRLWLQMKERKEPYDLSKENKKFRRVWKPSDQKKLLLAGQEQRLNYYHLEGVDVNGDETLNSVDDLFGNPNTKEYYNDDFRIG